MEKKGGYENIYENLVQDLNSINLAKAAEILELAVDPFGRVEIPFLGKPFFLGPDGVQDENGKKSPIIHGAVLAAYLLTRGRGETSGRFVQLDELTALVPSGGNYANTGLEPRLAKFARENPDRFEEAIHSFGGKPGGEVGSGGKSWIIQLLPKIQVQLILYQGDEEFPAVVHLLFDLTSINFLEFEFLAVLATIFVEEVGRHTKHGASSLEAIPK